MRSSTWLVLGVGLIASPGAAQTVESPRTVAPHAWLVEADVGSGVWHRSRVGAHRQDQRDLAVAATLLTTGVTEHVDVQFGWEGWHHRRSTGMAPTEHNSGHGDLLLRAKWRVAGDIEGPAAWALMPYVTLPTGDEAVDHGRWGHGLAVIFAHTLSAGDELGGMVAIDRQEHDPSGYAESWSGGVVWSRALNDRWGGYVEGLVEWDREAASRVPFTVGLGLAWTVRPTLTLDCEVLAGVSGGAPNHGVAFRLTWAP